MIPSQRAGQRRAGWQPGDGGTFRHRQQIARGSLQEPVTVAARRVRPTASQPVAFVTAQVIIAQQQRVRDRFPCQPVSRLALLPTTRANPDGGKPIPISSLDKAHREWVDSLPVLRTSDGREFDKARIIPYAYRHTYAQRHADAGVAPTCCAS